MVFSLLSVGIGAEMLIARERRAALIGLAVGGFSLAAGLTFFRLLLSLGQTTAMFILVLVISLFILLMFGSSVIPAKRIGAGDLIVGSVTRVDERDSVLARNRLRPGTSQYTQYYEAHPELEEVDEKRRSKGGPLAELGKIDSFNDFNIAACYALMSVPMFLGRTECVSPAPRDVAARMNSLELTMRVKEMARRLGASKVGVAKLNDKWVYSNIGEIYYGNWEDWGKKIDLPHRFAIVVATEMKRDMVMSSPHTPATIESIRNYSLGAYISVQIASLLANLGYEARAHHWRNYQVLAVPTAVDAGIGQVGRNGFVIAPEFGPRVRLAVVTTNAPLMADEPSPVTVGEFCKTCTRCAELCPAGAIQTGPKGVSNGTRRWTADGTACLEEWANLGTACERCIAVCPWGRGGRILRRLRFLLCKSALGRIAMLYLDRALFGRSQGSSTAPRWVGYENSAVISEENRRREGA